MAGHSKWAQIKRQKAVTDGKRSKIFSVLVKQITIEARQAKGDRNAPQLRAAVEKAKAANMPAENIERAIKRASETGSGNLEEVTFEIYGPGGAAIIVEGITDSRNRTVAEIKHILSEHGGTLAPQGGVMWVFDGRTPKNKIDLSESDTAAFDKLMEALDDHPDIKEIYANTGD